MEIDFTLNVNYFFINNTDVEISEELKSAHQEYVNYKDIDINSISEVAAEDSGDSVVEIFKNRIVSRLGYKEVEDNNIIHSYYKAISNLPFINPEFIIDIFKKIKKKCQKHNYLQF